MTTLVAIAGDLHTNSTLGVMPPTVRLDDGGEYRASPQQRWLWRHWVKSWAAVGEARDRHDARLVVILNGELADNNHHHTTQLVTRNPADQLNIAIETPWALADVLALEEGGVVELDRKADEPLDIMVNGTLIARGEVVVTDGRFGIRLIEIVGGDGGWALAEALG